MRLFKYTFRGCPTLSASRHARTREGWAAKHRAWKLLGLAALSLTLMAAGDSDVRYRTLGSRLMCPCGCSQMLLECNHVGCPDSDKIRKNLAAGVANGSSDDTILAGFVAEYGNTVLAAPTTHGFNRLAWIMPFAVLGAGLLLIWFVVRRWAHLAAALRPMRSAALQSASPAEIDELRRRAREETAL